MERKRAIEAAVTAVKYGKSIRGAAKQFGIPNSTLQDYCSKLLSNHAVTTSAHIYKNNWANI